jgi:hypothetical protein
MTIAGELPRGHKYSVREIHALSPSTESAASTQIRVFAWANSNTIGAFSDDVLYVVWGNFRESEIVIPEGKDAKATLRLRTQDIQIYLHRDGLPVEALISGDPNAKIKADAMVLSGGIGGNIIR